MIRFKKDDGSQYPEWEKKNLSAVLTVNSGKDYKHLNHGNIPVYGTGGYMLSVDQALSKNQDAIGLGRKGTIDKPYILKAPFWTVDTLFYLTPNNNDNLLFLYQLLKTINWKKLDESTGVPSLSKVSINAVNVQIPSLEEQQKIADFLSSVDEVIAESEKEVANLEVQKKGAMQKIFSQEVRFKADDGSDYPDWEEVNFDNLYKTIPHKKYQIPSSTVLSAGDFEVIDQGKKMIAGYYNKSEKVFEDLPVIVYGDHTTTVKYRDKKFIVGGDGVKLLKPQNCQAKFAYYCLQYFNVPQQGYRRHFSDLRDVSFVIPCLKEQQKIADFLSDFDIAIEEAKKELECWKQIKKGLLQQMFM